jgi:hypothetical protein
VIEIRKIQDGDLEQILADPFQDSLKKYPELNEDQKRIVNETSFAGVQDGELLGIGGVVDRGDGIGEAWLMLVKDIGKSGASGLMAFHAIRKKLDELCEPFDKCQALIRDDFPKAQAMIKALGFEFVETFIERSPDGVDMHLFLKVSDE